MNLLTSIEVAEKWGVSQRRVVRLAQDGRISGARLIGKNWMIPENASKPSDKRTKTATDIPSFRFPIFVNFDSDRYSPPLSEDETALREAQLDYYSGNFAKSEPIFKKLEVSSESPFIKIAAMYYQCLISVYYHEGRNYEKLRFCFNMALADNLNYKKEMEIFSYLLDTDLGFLDNVYDNLNIDETYDYHSSTYYILCSLSVFSSTKGDLSFLNKMKFDTYEILVKMMESEGHYFEAQFICFTVFSVYHLLNNKEKMFYYLNEALKIAEERKLYILPSTYEAIYPSDFKIALANFSNEFSRKILSIGNGFHSSYTRFVKNRQNFNCYSLLSKTDYQYIIYASQGYLIKDVASITNHSTRYVSNRYSQIYAKLGIKSKKEIAYIVKK